VREKKKSDRRRSLFSFLFLLLGRFKVVFANAAEGADPVVRDLLEGGAGGDAAVRIAYRGIINVTTYKASKLLHNVLFLMVYIYGCCSFAFSSSRGGGGGGHM
jgi:hypothetical protein